MTLPALPALDIKVLPAVPGLPALETEVLPAVPGPPALEVEVLPAEAGLPAVEALPAVPDAFTTGSLSEAQPKSAMAHEPTRNPATAKAFLMSWYLQPPNLSLFYPTCKHLGAERFPACGVNTPDRGRATFVPTMRTGNAKSRILGYLGIAWLTSGCSLLYQPREQCEVDSDCVRLARTEASLAGSYCQDHACVLPQVPRRDCTTNQECIKAAYGDAAICRDNQCVSLRSGTCGEVLNEDVLREINDVVVLGAFERLDKVDRSQRAGFESFKLAAFQMQERVHGAIGFEYATVRRPYVFVVCDNTPGVALDAAFDHLTKVLKVPVAITTLQPSDLLAQWNRLGGDALVDTMFINAFASDSSLESLQTKGHIWSLLGSPTEDLGPAYVQLVHQQLAKVTANPAHVLAVISNLTAMHDIAAVVEGSLTINGQSVTAAAASGAYRRVVVEPPGSDGQTETSDVLAAVTETAPDLVIVLGGDELIESAIMYNEAIATSKRASDSSSSKYYVLSHHLAGSPALLAAVSGEGASTKLHRRMLGLNYAGAKDLTLYNEYLLNLWNQNEALPAGHENYFDAAQYAMLSITGVANQRPTREFTGSLASRGFRRLIDVQPGVATFGLRPSELMNIAAELERSDTTTIAVTGTLGPPNFSVQTGTRHTDASVWCYRQNMLNGGGLEWAADVVRFDVTEGKFNQDPDTCQQAVE